MSISEQDSRNLELARAYQRELMRLLPGQGSTFLQTIEALASSERAGSIVELTEEDRFERQYSSIYKAVDALSAKLYPKFLDMKGASAHEQWMKMLFAKLPEARERAYDLYAIDASSMERIHANTLEDRSYIHVHSPCGGHVSIGLQANALVALPEQQPDEANWPLPLSIIRIPSKKTATEVAQEQLDILNRLSADHRLSVIVADAGYTKLRPASANQLIVVRTRSDRVGRRHFATPKGGTVRKGRPKKYNDMVIRFAEDHAPEDPSGPDERDIFDGTHRSKEVTFLVSRWRNVYVHGQPSLVDIIKVEAFRKDGSYTPVFNQPLLLMVAGERRHELTGQEVLTCYRQRFDIEHHFRFTKQELLLDGSETPELRRQEAWWWMCCFAYWLLYLVRSLAPNSARKWIKKRPPERSASPGEVKRVFGSSIFPILGSPSRPPLPRGKSKGRPKGCILPKRPRHKPVKKHPPWPRAA